MRSVAESQGAWAAENMAGNREDELVLGRFFNIVNLHCRPEVSADLKESRGIMQQALAPSRTHPHLAAPASGSTRPAARRSALVVRSQAR